MRAQVCDKVWAQDKALGTARLGARVGVRELFRGAVDAEVVFEQRLRIKLSSTALKRTSVLAMLVVYLMSRHRGFLKEHLVAVFAFIRLQCAMVCSHLRRE